MTFTGSFTLVLTFLASFFNSRLVKFLYSEFQNYFCRYKVSESDTIKFHWMTGKSEMIYYYCYPQFAQELRWTEHIWDAGYQTSIFMSTSCAKEYMYFRIGMNFYLIIIDLKEYQLCNQFQRFYCSLSPHYQGPNNRWSSGALSERMKLTYFLLFLVCRCIEFESNK